MHQLYFLKTFTTLTSITLSTTNIFHFVIEYYDVFLFNIACMIFQDKYFISLMDSISLVCNQTMLGEDYTKFKTWLFCY